MAFPSRMELGDVPFKYLFNFYTTVQALSLLLDDSSDVGREVLREAGLQETQIDYLYDRFTRPVLEVLLHNWQGTVRDLDRILTRTNQVEARNTLFQYLHENVRLVNPDIRDLFQPPRREDWEDVLSTTRYQFSKSITWPEIVIRTCIRPFCNRVKDLLLPSLHASDMYRAISNIINFGTKLILGLTIIQTASALYWGRLQNLVTIFISLSLWVKLYLIREPLRELQQILPCGSDRVRRADFLYKQVRIALLFAFYFKLVLAVLGATLFCAFPQFLLNDLHSQMTQIVIFLFTFELVHNAFYLVAFYRDPNIYRNINNFFPYMRL